MNHIILFYRCLQLVHVLISLCYWNLTLWLILTLPLFVQNYSWSKCLFFKYIKKLYLFLWWLQFSLKNLKFSIKNFISLLLNTFMIYGFYSLGGEMYIKSELMDSFLSWCEIWLVYLWNCNLRNGFLSYLISLKEHWKRFEKDPSWICDYKIFQ